jgi:hypothetical protein
LCRVGNLSLFAFRQVLLSFVAAIFVLWYGIVRTRDVNAIVGRDGSATSAYCLASFIFYVSVADVMQGWARGTASAMRLQNSPPVQRMLEQLQSFLLPAWGVFYVLMVAVPFVTLALPERQDELLTAHYGSAGVLLLGAGWIWWFTCKALADVLDSPMELATLGRAQQEERRAKARRLRIGQRVLVVLAIENGGTNALAGSAAFDCSPLSWCCAQW